MGSNQSSFPLKMVLSKRHFIPYPFLCVHWWIVESPPLFGNRMPYGSFIVCMFWIRWRCQPTCAICRCLSGLDNYLQKFCQRISCHIQWEKSFCMRIRGDGTAPRRSVTMNDEPILWNSQIWHLGNFITHGLSDLNDITYKKGVFISQVNRLNARFPFGSSGVKGHLLQTYCCSFYGCQTWDLYEKHVNQLNVEWNKAVRRTLNLPYKTHRRLLPLIVNGKSFKRQHCSRLHKYVNGFFSSENIYVSFIGAKAKTRVTGSSGRNRARLAVMDGLVPFDPLDEHTSAHVGMIKELLDMWDGINECLHLSRTEIDDLIYHLCCEW